MVKALLEILQTLNVPVYRQGSLSNDETYPETFITFWNDDAPDHAHYNNTEYGTAWAFTVNVYSSDPTVPLSMIETIRAALKAAGWVVQGRGYDVPSDEPTHAGRGITCSFLEIPKDEEPEPEPEPEEDPEEETEI